jgi:hypothetical protein
MRPSLLVIFLCLVNVGAAGSLKVIESLALLGEKSETAYEKIVVKLLPGSSVSNGVKSRNFAIEIAGRPFDLHLGEDGEGNIMTVNWLFAGPNWPLKELLKLQQEISRELFKSGWRTAKTAALVDNQQLFGKLESISRGENTVNLGLTLRRDAPRAEITFVLGLPTNGVADGFVPSLAVEMSTGFRNDMIYADP